MARGFVHVNGVTYQLAAPVDDGAIMELVQRLEPLSQPEPGSIEPRRTRLQHTQRLDVVKDGQTFSLLVDRYRLWSSAAWAEPESA